MLIIAGHTEVDPDDRNEAVAVMRDQLTRACDALGCLDVAITADSVDPTGAVLTGRRTAEQVDHWNGDHLGVPIFVPNHRPPGPTVAGYPRVTYVPDGIESARTPALRRADVADRVGGRSGDRHPGGHPHPLPHPSPN